MESIRETIRKNCMRLLDKSNRTMNLAEIARLTGVSQTTIQRWKTGENSPEISNIESLANAMGVDPWEFYRHEQPIKPFAETLKVSRLMDLMGKKVNSIPDDIYELAVKVGLDDKSAWDNVRAALEVAIELREERSKNA